MSSSALAELSKIEARLWQAADPLRANSKLTRSEYCLPVLGVTFLRHASDRFDAALAASEADQTWGRMPRRTLVQTGDVDVMLAVRPNFIYTHSVPCELWFYDRGKPAARRDSVLMLDARQVFRKLTRKIFDVSPEQLADLAAVVWLYRGEQARFEALLAQHLGSAVRAAQACWRDAGAGLPVLPLDGQVSGPLDEFAATCQALRGLMQPLVARCRPAARTRRWWPSTRSLMPSHRVPSWPCGWRRSA